VDGSKLVNRVDRFDLESGDWLHENQSGVQALLCRADGQTAPGDGVSQLSQRVCRHAAPAGLGSSTAVAEITGDFCQFHKNQCIATGVPFFFKQWGGTNKKKAGRLLERRTWDEMPTFEASPSRKQSNAATGSYSIERVSQTLRIYTSRNRKSLCSLAKVSH